MDNNERIQSLSTINYLCKPCNEIIERNSHFFQELKNVKDIYIIGHSCSEIDFPYFQKIKESVDTRAIWHFSPYSDKDIFRMNILIKMMGVEFELTTGI